MSASDTAFTGSIPDIYDDYLVPLIFEYYASDIAERIAGLGCSNVLETAAGSGVLTRAVAPVLPRAARFTVTDLNPPMIDRARRRQPPDARIDWLPADMTALPFEDGAFDAVLCQFGVMFLPDRPKGFAEARRVLAPGGSYIFNTWDRMEVNVFAEVVTEAASELFPEKPPRFLERTPHGYHDTDQIAADLRAGGFTRFEIETIPAASKAPSPRHPAVAYCQGTPMRNELEALDAARLDEVTDHATAAVAARFGDGAISGLMQAHVVTATA